MDDAGLTHHVTRIERDGYTVLDRVVEPALLDELASEFARLERGLGVVPSANSFEGERTLRVYNLLARGRVWQRVPVHDEVLPVVERVLDRGCLVSSLSSIDILPGETAQPIHADDMLERAGYPGS